MWFSNDTFRLLRYVKPAVLSMDAVKLRFKGLLATGLLSELVLRWPAGATFRMFGDMSPSTRRPGASFALT